MRRSLALTDEGARHPFRVSLPPHVCRGDSAPEREAERKTAWMWRISAQDVREFLLAYCACFLAVSLYIA